MRIAAIIPARYDSSRLKGKPLADLCGRPMIWWVYSQVKKSSRIHEVVVATDSEEIRAGLPTVRPGLRHDKPNSQDEYRPHI